MEKFGSEQVEFYKSLGIDEKQIDYVVEKTSSEKYANEVLEGIVTINLLKEKRDESEEITVSSVVGLYKKAKRDGNLKGFKLSDLTSYIVDLAHAQEEKSGYSMISNVIDQALKLDNPWNVGSYISRMNSLKLVVTEEPIIAKYERPEVTEETVFDVMMSGMDFVSADKFLQVDYRTNPLDQSHMVEHVFEQFLENKFAYKDVLFNSHRL